MTHTLHPDLCTRRTMTRSGFDVERPEIDQDRSGLQSSFCRYLLELAVVWAVTSPCVPSVRAEYRQEDYSRRSGHEPTRTCTEGSGELLPPRLMDGPRPNWLERGHHHGSEYPVPGGHPCVTTSWADRQGHHASADRSISVAVLIAIFRLLSSKMRLRVTDISACPSDSSAVESGCSPPFVQRSTLTD